jgi:hypothetical protein
MSRPLRPAPHPRLLPPPPLAPPSPPLLRKLIAACLNPASADSNQNGILDAFAKTTRRGWETSSRIIDHNTHTFTQSGDFLIWPNSAACSLFYDLQTDTPGLHLLEVSAANWAAVTIPNYSFEFAVYANGIAVGTIAIPARAN